MTPQMTTPFFQLWDWDMWMRTEFIRKGRSGDIGMHVM